MKIFVTKSIIPVILFLSVIVFSCSNDETTATSETTNNTITPDTGAANMNQIPDTTSVPMVSSAEAILNATFPDTALAGTVKFESLAENKVKMILEITVAAKSNKTVAVHIHEHGDCGDKGNLSHGHWNPTNAQHGKWGGSSFHSGDIGNVKLDGKGKGTLTLETDLWTLGGRADKNILNKAIIVHGGADDFTTQPTGNSGTRIGCGVIK